MKKFIFIKIKKNIYIKLISDISIILPVKI